MAEQEKGAKSAKKKRQRIRKWFRDLKSESKKVVWPTRSQVINNTLVVIGMVLLVGMFIWVLDLAFGELVKLLTSLL